MKNKNIPNKLPQGDDDFLKALPKVDVPFSRTKEEVWASMEQLMQEAETPTQSLKPQAKKRTLQSVWMSAAAVAVLLLASVAFMRFYSKTIDTLEGQQFTAMLPGGSSVELNAASSIKYQPLWWRFNRSLQFEGEGFFKVQKGSSFTVHSSMGETTVLGTSFNIYARKSNYTVTCYTGKVRVVSVESGKAVNITPNMQAQVNEHGEVLASEKVHPNETIAWRNGLFIFNATPIQLVFDEIERQYGIRLRVTSDFNYMYSGSFTRDRSVEEVLHTICLPLGLQYKKVDAHYEIYR